MNTLFDDEPERTSYSPTDSKWREIPQAEFLALSERDQLDYCARRDEDSALYATTDEDAQWYRRRAAAYRQLIEKLV
jgi:hypothetical protein